MTLLQLNSSAAADSGASRVPKRQAAAAFDQRLAFQKEGAWTQMNTKCLPGEGAESGRISKGVGERAWPGFPHCLPEHFSKCKHLFHSLSFVQNTEFAVALTVRLFWWFGDASAGDDNRRSTLSIRPSCKHLICVFRNNEEKPDKVALPICQEAG